TNTTDPPPVNISPVDIAGTVVLTLASRVVNRRIGVHGDPSRQRRPLVRASQTRTRRVRGRRSWTLHLRAARGLDPKRRAPVSASSVSHPVHDGLGAFAGFFRGGHR